MSITFEVLSDGNRPLVVKRADGADGARLRSDAERVQAASHPGVVQVVSSAATPDDGWELRMVHGGRPLDVVPSMSPAQVAMVSASLAATLADLHAVGIVHGRVDSSHVLVGPHGRPVLCGFAHAAGVTAEAADDVAGVGSMMVSLLGTENDEEPIPERRWQRRRRWTGWERRALLTLADQACAEPSAHRPTARRLAAAISAAVPTAGTSIQLPSEAAATGVVPAPPSVVDPLDALRASSTVPLERSGPRPVAVVLAAAGVAALVVGVYRSGDEPGSASAPLVATTVTTAEDALAPTTSMVAPVGCGPVGGVDLNGDGCREPVSVEGRTIEVGNVRFLAGADGDQVAVRDWDCDGEATPAVFRPSTGEVFVFARWDPAGDLVVEPVATVAGGTELVVAPRSEACSGLGVRTASSVVEIVRLPT